MRLTRLIFLVTLGFATAATAETAPDFTLENDSGKSVRLEEQRGKVVMINFWASWCAPCRAEMPHLDALYDRFEPEGFTLFGINVEQNLDAAGKFLESVDVSFSILYDPDSKVSRAYGVNAMPTTVLVDRNGQIRYVNRGYRKGDEKKYRKQVEALIRE